MMLIDKAHRIRVEEEKTEEERSTYLHPELSKEPAAKSVETARHPASRKLTHTPAQRTASKR